MANNLDFLNGIFNKPDDDDQNPIPYRNGYDPSQSAAPVVPMVKPQVVAPIAQAPDDQEEVAAASVPDQQSAQAIKDPALRDYLLSKLKNDFSDDKYKEAVADGQNRKSGLGWAQFAAGIGDALAGRNPSSSAAQFDNLRKDVDANTTGQFEAGKKQLIENANTEAQVNQMQKAADQTDANSPASQSFRKMIEASFPQIAKAYGDNWQNVTAADSENIFQPLKLKETMDARKEATAARLQQGQDSRDAKANDKQNQALQQTTSMLEQMRGSPAAAQAEKDIYAAQKVNSMVNLYGDPNKLNPSQVQLLATEVAKIASGGVPSTHELQGLNPSTISSSLASLAQKVMNKPEGANAGEFVKAMQDYTNSLTKDAKEVIKDRYGRIIETNRNRLGDDNYNTLQSNYIKRFDNQAKQAPQSNKIKVSNGKETLMIDPNDIDHAKADGYEQVKQ